MHTMIVLVEPGKETELETAIKEVGFLQINQPYDVEEVVGYVGEILRPLRIHPFRIPKC